jgi:hypothetical protein
MQLKRGAMQSAKRQDGRSAPARRGYADVQDVEQGPALHTAHAASNLFYAAPRLISNQRLDAPARRLRPPKTDRKCWLS